MVRAGVGPRRGRVAADQSANLVGVAQLLQRGVGFDDPVGSNALEVNVTRLRSKLAPDGPAIRIVRGVGYMLDRS